MLQDPSRDVLRPLTENEAESFRDLAVELRPGETLIGDLPTRISVSGSGGGHTLLTAAEKCEPGGDASYPGAYEAFCNGRPARSAAQFLTVALARGPAAPALYGLASALVELEEFEAAGEIAQVVSKIPGYGDPRAAALAGFAAFKLGQPKRARLNLALAARLARGRQEFRPVQRFCQAVLLTQQFGTSD